MVQRIFMVFRSLCKFSRLHFLDRYMADFKPVTALDMSDCLKAHPMHKAARAVMADKLKECVQNDVSEERDSPIQIHVLPM